jgi:two-component system response regulator CpxR
MDEPLERILVIDDDRELCSLLAEYLKPDGFEVEEAHDGKKGMEMALSRKYSLLVLDVMLPGSLNGFSVLQLLRAKTAVPILMLSARGDDVDRILGLEMGADDYLSKPFNPREFLARVRTILRRSRSLTQESIGSTSAVRYKVGDVELDSGARVAYYENEPVELTSMEFTLLEVLLRNAGQVVTREKLASDVLDRTLSPYDRSIDVHISKLRKKLGHRNCGTERIKAIRGLGYVYTVPSSSESELNDSRDIAQKEYPDAQN